MASFHEQAAKGDASALTTLLAADPDALNSVDADGRTPLHWAADKAAERCMQCLLEEGKAAIDAQDALGFTPLHLAARERRTALSPP